LGRAQIGQACIEKAKAYSSSITIKNEDRPMMVFIPHHPNSSLEHFGLIPGMLDAEDPRPARDQFNEKYYFGWSPQPKFELGPGDRLYYPGDPPFQPIAELIFRHERIVLYEGKFVAIIQLDGSFEVCRMD
jgi:hypothetical protein